MTALITGTSAGQEQTRQCLDVELDQVQLAAQGAGLIVKQLDGDGAGFKLIVTDPWGC